MGLIPFRTLRLSKKEANVLLNALKIYSDECDLPENHPYVEVTYKLIEQLIAGVR